MAGGTVKYVAVREHLARRIAAMAPGDQLPTEPVLCNEYAVSRITVRRAVEDLIRDGRLVREQGRGTFVTSPSYLQQVRETFSDRVTGFYRQQSLLGRHVTTSVIHNRTVRKPEAALALGRNPADELVELERLRYVNDTLHQHVVTYLPKEQYGEVLEQDLTQGSLFDFLERRYGVLLTRNDLLVRLERVTGDVAEALGVTTGECVLAIDSTVFTDVDVPVAFGTTRHTPSNSEIAFSLRHQPSGMR